MERIQRALVSVEKPDEKGAFQVNITFLSGKKVSRKWFRGEKTKPVGFLDLHPQDYRIICGLIDMAYIKKEKQVWPRPFDKAAYAHEMRSKAVGAC
jgi:hypothetical protein